MKRSSVLSPPPQLVFPAPTLERKCQTRVKKWQGPKVKLLAVTSLTKIKSFIASLTPEEVIWIERVSDETGFVENSVPKFRPFSDEDFCGVAKSFRRRVEVL